MIHQKVGKKLKKLLNLENDLVAIKWSFKEPKNMPQEEGKSRFCQKLEMARDGQIFYSKLENEKCMGGARYSGLGDEKNFPTSLRTGQFLVGAGVFENIPAVQRAWRKNLCIPPEIFKAVIFAPLELAEFEPDVIFIICNARQAMELLHANAYDKGVSALGADSGPICSSMASLPYLTGKITYGFGDVGSRKYMNIEEDQVMVSIPASELERITINLEKMRTKTYFKEKN